MSGWEKILFRIQFCHLLIFFTSSGFFRLKWIEGITNIHPRPQLLKSNMRVSRKQKFSKKVIVKKYILCENFKNLKEKKFLDIRRWSDKLSFEALFVQIGCEFCEILHVYVSFRFWLHFFFRDKTRNFEGTSKRFTFRQSEHQHFSDALWDSFKVSVRITPVFIL